MIKLVPIDEKNYAECLKLKVYDHQNHFVASNERSLAQAYIYRKNVEAYALYNEESMVGFIQMIPEDDNPKCMYLWRFMIDYQHQQKGYGKRAMQAFIDTIKSRNAFVSIKLSVEPDNTVAIHLYESLGFKTTGVIDEGEAEMILTF